MIVSTTIGGIPVELFLIDPDWKKNFEIEATIPVDSSIGETGKESRHLEGEHPRFKFSFTPDWEKADSEDIVTLAATVGTKRVAMPVFPDAQASISDTFLFEGQHYVSWNDSGQWVVDADTYEYVAPLAFGYLENNKFQGITEELGTTRLTFVEDSPHTHRLGITAFDVTDNFTLVPESKKVKQNLTSPIQRQEIGHGRERGVERQEDVFRYEMDTQFKLLGQDEIGYMLSFWYQNKGRLHTFIVPAFFQPANATDNTPDSYRARFKGERLKLSFKSPTVASTNVSFIQVPWELNDSGVDWITDTLFEDESQWDGFSDANVDVVSGISTMPDRCLRIDPSVAEDKQLLTQQIDAVGAGDFVRFSATMARDASLTNDMDLRIRAYDAGDNLIGASTAINYTPNTFSSTQEVTWTIPSSTAYITAALRVPFNGSGLGSAYFGDPRLTIWQDGTETLMEEPVQDARCYAFTFDFDIPSKSSLHYIDWEREVTQELITYQPYKMELNNIMLGSRLFKEELSITYMHESDNPLLAFVEGSLERLVTITVKEGNPYRPDTFKSVFVGTLKGIRGKGRRLTATFTPFGGIFDRRLPGFKMQNRCNYRFCDANCKLSISSFKAEASTIGSGDLSNDGYTVRCDSMTGTLTNPTDPNSNAGDRFAAGYLEIGTGDDYQIRMVKKTTVHAGNDRSFDLNRPLDATKLDNSDGNIDVFAGCGGTNWECNFYLNYVNFGGHPYAPDKLDTVQGQTPKAGK